MTETHLWWVNLVCVSSQADQGRYVSKLQDAKPGGEEVICIETRAPLVPGKEYQLILQEKP